MYLRFYFPATTTTTLSCGEGAITITSFQNEFGRVLVPQAREHRLSFLDLRFFPFPFAFGGPSCFHFRSQSQLLHGAISSASAMPTPISRRRRLRQPLRGPGRGFATFLSQRLTSFPLLTSVSTAPTLGAGQGKESKFSTPCNLPRRVRQRIVALQTLPFSWGGPPPTRVLLFDPSPHDSESRCFSNLSFTAERTSSLAGTPGHPLLLPQK